jgi:hypothetical protein
MLFGRLMSLVTNIDQAEEISQQRNALAYFIPTVSGFKSVTVLTSGANPIKLFYGRNLRIFLIS